MKIHAHLLQVCDCYVFYVYRYLTEYSESGDFSSLDLIDNLGSSMLLSTKLTFLGKKFQIRTIMSKVYGQRRNGT